VICTNCLLYKSFAAMFGLFLGDSVCYWLIWSGLLHCMFKVLAIVTPIVDSVEGFHFGSVKG
jgi:hypothetical protein